MQSIKQFNLVIAFLLEIAVLVALACYGFQAGKNPWTSYLLACLLPLIAALLWGIFAAPRSSRRIPFPYRILFEVLMLLPAVLFLYAMGMRVLSVCLGFTILLSKLFSFFYKQ